MNKKHLIIAAVAVAAFMIYRKASSAPKPVTGAGGFVLNQWAKV
jgi:hypothetical protein